MKKTYINKKSFCNSISECGYPLCSCMDAGQIRYEEGLHKYLLLHDYQQKNPDDHENRQEMIRQGIINQLMEAEISRQKQERREFKRKPKLLKIKIRKSK